MKILYIIDWVNARGGAHIATFMLIRELIRLGHRVDVLTRELPNEKTLSEVPGVRFVQAVVPGKLVRGVMRFGCLHSVNLYALPLMLLDPFRRIRNQMSQYDVACVMSEESVFRKLVADLPRSVRKVQLIHTNYRLWKKYSPRSYSATLSDKEVYSRYDVIGVVGTVNADELRLELPILAARVRPFHNLLELNRIVRRKHVRLQDPIQLVTLARLDDVPPKDPLRMLRVAQKLRKRGLRFEWTIWGNDGGLKPLVHKMGLDDVLHLKGFEAEARNHIAEADLMVLISHFEGLPNVIYESFAAGVPVFATNVGGVAEQIQDGVNGWLVPDDEGRIEGRLRDLLSHSRDVFCVAQRLLGCQYDNERALSEHIELLGL